MRLHSRVAILLCAALAGACERTPAPMRPTPAPETGRAASGPGVRTAWVTAHAAADTCATCRAPHTDIPGPRDLTASVSGTTVTLSWTAVLTTSWIVEAGSAPGLSDLAAMDVGNPPRNPELVTFTNVPPGIYYVRVSAFISNLGLTQPSNEAVVLVGNTCAPDPPAGLTAAVSGRTVSLAWTAGGTCAADHFVVQAGSAPGLTDLVNAPTPGAAPAFAAGNVADGVYFVRVHAANGTFVSGPSSEVVVSVGAVCGAAAAPAALAALVSGSTVGLTWSAPSDSCRPTTYIVQAGSAPGLSGLVNIPIGGAVPSFSAAGVATGTYYVRVRAGYGSVISAPTNEVIVRVGSSAPDFTGRWDGGYFVTGCRNIDPAGLTPLNLCGIAPSQGFELSLSQSGTAVSGTYTLRAPLYPCACSGNYGTFPVAGTVASDGTLTLSGSGSIPSTSVIGTFTLGLRTPNPLTLDGTISTDLTFGGILRGSFTGTLVSVARQ